MKVAIALGASMGDRRRALGLAWAGLQLLSDLGPARPSRVYQTPPAGGIARSSFLNAACRIDTSASPEAVLHTLQGIEQRLGRRASRRDADRLADLDLLLYGDLILQTATLNVPHPRMGERPFVLQPLLDVWPDATDPVSGRPWAAFLPGPVHPVVGVLPASGPRCRPAASRSALEDLPRHRQPRRDP